jgi:GST-like protein
MIDFHGTRSPNSIKVFIALEEMGLPYEVFRIDVMAQEQFTPEFTRLNPNQKAPVIVDHDGPDGQPFTIFESGAILAYLADKTGQLIPQDKAGRFRTLQWVFHQHAGLGPMSGQLAHFLRFAPPGLDPYSEQRYRSENNRLYDLYDGELAKRPYIAGDSYTIADVAVWPLICHAEMHGLDLARRKHFKAWFDRVAERPAVRGIIDRFGWPKDRAEVGPADPDAVDRFFGRGKYARV